MIYYNSVDEAINALILTAKLEVGYMEKKSNSNLYDKTANAGSANYTKYGKEMHDLYPAVMDYPASWCDAYVDWCFYKTFGICNAKKILCGDFNDYTVASAQLYKNKKAWYSSPKKGDQIFFKNSTRIYHTGIVYKVDSNYVYTIEGNTSNGSAVVANGGMVCMKKYALNNSRIAGYGRPLYSLAVGKGNYHKVSTGKDGLTIKTNSLNIRSIAGTGNVIGSYKLNDHVYPINKTFINDTVWYQTDKGWISADYVKGWVQEKNNSWWYVHNGYTYTKNDWEQINGLWYYFDENGYAVKDSWKLINNHWYLFNSDCVMLTGWQLKDGKWYYLEPDYNNPYVGACYKTDENGAQSIWEVK